MTKSAKIKRILIVLLVTVLAVALPASFAKYIDSKTYTLHLTKTEVFKFFFNTSTNKPQVVELPKAGRYAIVVKGGDGANGNVINNTTISSTDIQGGLGGTVAGVYTTTEDNQYVYVAPGAAGSRAKVKNSSGEAGDGGTIDGLSNFAGGKGGTLSYSDSTLAKTLSAAPAGGGGGAASAVYVCDSKGNYNANNDLLLIAGGGGGAGNWNEAYKEGVYIGYIIQSVPAAIGGNATGNFMGDSASTNNSSQSVNYDWAITRGIFTKNSIEVLAGLDGGGSDTTHGIGGLINPGRAATSAHLYNLVFTWAMPAGTAEQGATYANGGNGGAGDFYGGGGGGGYCGGGGGAGASLEIPSGGGGGGSSVISNLITQTDNSIYTTMINNAKNTKTCYKNGTTPTPIPTQYPLNSNGGEGNGYVIIMYLGPNKDGDEVPTNETKTLADVMDFIVTTSQSNKPKSGTTTITNSSTTTFSKAITNDPCAALLLKNRAWQISVDNNGNVTVSFTENRSTSIVSGTKFWQYKDGQWKTGNAYRSNTWSAWGYPNTWTNSTTAFVVTA